MTTTIDRFLIHRKLIPQVNKPTEEEIENDLDSISDISEDKQHDLQVKNRWNQIFAKRKDLQNSDNDESGDDCDDGPQKPDAILDNYEDDGFIVDDDESIEYSGSENGENDYANYGGFTDDLHEEENEQELVKQRKKNEFRRNFTNVPNVATVAENDMEIDIPDNATKSLNPHNDILKARALKQEKQLLDPKEYFLINEMRCLGDAYVAKVLFDKKSEEDRQREFINDLIRSAFPIKGNLQECMTFDDLDPDFDANLLLNPTILEAEINFSL